MAKGNSIESKKLTNEINDLFDQLETQIDELNDLIRKQHEENFYTREELVKKEDAYDNLRKIFKKYQIREEKFVSFEFDDPTDEDVKWIAEIGGFDNEGDGNQAQARDLTKKEQDALDQWKKEDAELDDMIMDIDKGMDVLLEGIDDIGENLNDQQGLIKDIDSKVDTLKSKLGTASIKMKRVLAKWRSAPSVATDIVMFIILAVLIGTLVIVVKKFVLKW